MIPAHVSFTPKNLILTCFLCLTLIPSMFGNIIDLTPGGFDIGNGIPTSYSRLWTETFFDEAAVGTFDLPKGPTFIDGWVSQFGSLDGGQYFFTDLFDVSPASSAKVTWDFTGQPDGYWLSTIYLFGRKADGSPVENIYEVPYADQFVSPGDQTVTLDDSTTIWAIGFYGSKPNPATDNGTTLLLFALLVVPLIVLKKLA